LTLDYRFQLVKCSLANNAPENTSLSDQQPMGAQMGAGRENDNCVRLKLLKTLL